MHPTLQWRVWNPNKHGLEGGMPNEIDGQEATVPLPYDGRPRQNTLAGQNLTRLTWGFGLKPREVVTASILALASFSATKKGRIWEMFLVRIWTSKCVVTGSQT